MAFSDFSYPKVETELGLTVREADLYSQVVALSLRAEFTMNLADGTQLALAINTEKARSEFIIAPVLQEVRKQVMGAVGLFSGVELSGDPARGLSGICDFILTKTPRQFVLSAPLIVIVEAKNDSVFNGLGQCIAAVVAAELFNQKSGTPLPAVFGVVTTGSAWKFLKLEGNTLTLDLAEYYIVSPGKIVGVLKHIIQTA